MLTRIITSLVALCVLIPVLIFSNTWVFPIAVAIFCAIAVFEALKCVGVIKKWALSLPLIIASFFGALSGRIFLSVDSWLVTMACIAFAIVLYLMAILVFSKGKLEVSDVAISSFISFYITIGFSSLVLLHDCFENGSIIYILVFVGAWITDIFAYFCGRFFGKHKLIPEVSPKKTIEGSIGGTLFSGIAFVLFGIIVKALNFDIGQTHLLQFVFGIVAAVVAQIGDLSMSALKRKYGIKDFGKLFPGHGGVLDRFDSIISVSTVLLILNILVK